MRRNNSEIGGEAKMDNMRLKSKTVYVNYRWLNPTVIRCSNMWLNHIIM